MLGAYRVWARWQRFPDRPLLPPRCANIVLAATMACGCVAAHAQTEASDVPQNGGDVPTTEAPPANAADQLTSPAEGGRARSGPRKRTRELPEKPIEQIVVPGHKLSAIDQRRYSTAAKIVVEREEIEQFGDSTVADVLKRLPGITIGGKPGRGRRGCA